jgi:hypothetical protein
MDRARQVPKWQLPTSRDPAVLRAELQWLEAEDRASCDALNELLADKDWTTPEKTRMYFRRLIDANIADAHAKKKMAALRDLRDSVEAAARIAARAPAPTAAVAPSRGVCAAHVADAAQRATAAASKKRSADNDDDATEPIAPGCPSLPDAAAVLAPLRTALQRVVDAACGAWFAACFADRSLR